MVVEIPMKIHVRGLVVSMAFLGAAYATAVAPASSSSSSTPGASEQTSVRVIPASIVPWETWKDEHPDTSVLVNNLGDRRGFAHGTQNDFVIGVSLEDSAVAYGYPMAAQQGVTTWSANIR